MAWEIRAQACWAGRVDERPSAGCPRHRARSVRTLATPWSRGAGVAERLASCVEAWARSQSALLQALLHAPQREQLMVKTGGHDFAPPNETLVHWGLPQSLKQAWEAPQSVCLYVHQLREVGLRLHLIPQPRMVRVSAVELEMDPSRLSVHQ
eukprot:2474700-Amphidinium_carterae.1